MTIGIDRFRDPRELWLHRMLLQPLRGDFWNRTEPAKRAMSAGAHRLGALLAVAGVGC